MKTFIFYILFAVCFIIDVNASDHIKVGIDEKLGATISMDVPFKDASGNDVILKDLISSSDVTILAFVYYRCPAICSPLLFELSEIVNKTDLELGYDFNILSISIDELETPDVALEKKRTFLSAIDNKTPENSWKFLKKLLPPQATIF